MDKPQPVALEPCPNPWCISSTVPMLMGTGQTEQDRQWVVRCGCGVVTHRRATEDEAIAAWNTRAVLASALEAARREALAQAADHARCAFDDRPRTDRGIDWTDGFDDGTKAAEAAIRALIGEKP